MAILRNVYVFVRSLTSRCVLPVLLRAGGSLSGVPVTPTEVTDGARCQGVRSCLRPRCSKYQHRRLLSRCTTKARHTYVLTVLSVLPMCHAGACTLSLRLPKVAGADEPPTLLDPCGALTLNFGPNRTIKLDNWNYVLP